MEIEKFYGTGRRKNAVARICMAQGEGKILINKREIKAYLHTESAVNHALFPLVMTSMNQKYDIKVNVYGGGTMGQAGAIRHAISSTLLHANPNLRLVLKRAGLLTRDSRIKERKKYGQKGARKKFQFSKR